MTKGYGFSVAELSMMCPSDLEPYYKAHDLELDEKDTYVYMSAYRYGVDILTYTLDHLFSGNKSKAKLNEQSIRAYIHEQERAQRPLTQNEIIEETKKFFMQRKIDKINFDRMQKLNSRG